MGAELDSGFVGIPLQSILAFTRITTHPRYPGQRFTVPQSTDIVDSWLVRPKVDVLMPGVSHWSICRDLMLAVNARANLSTDAHIAALAIEHDATLFTADTDFARFPHLRWCNPLTLDD